MSKVTDLGQWKKRKEPNSIEFNSEDISERIQKARNCLDKINSLMADLKRMAHESKNHIGGSYGNDSTKKKDQEKS